MKKILIVELLLFYFIFLTACSFFSRDAQMGNNDWSYQLPNDYVIWHVNSRKIVCGKKTTENSISYIGGSYILKFCFNHQYICLQCADVSDDLSQDIDESNPQFYIIDTVSDQIIGPLSEGEFLIRLDELCVDNLSSWIVTKPKPEGAQFP